MATSIPTKRRQALARWTALLRRHRPSLSLPEVKGLALWSIGIVLARSSSLHAVVLALVCWLPFNPFSLRRRLQEWYREASAKKGHGTAAWGCTAALGTPTPPRRTCSPGSWRIGRAGNWSWPWTPPTSATASPS